MALNGSGTISIGGSIVGQSVNLELGRAATATSSMNESALRTLAAVGGGSYSMSAFYGKSATRHTGTLTGATSGANNGFISGSLGSYTNLTGATLTRFTWNGAFTQMNFSAELPGAPATITVTTVGGAYSGTMNRAAAGVYDVGVNTWFLDSFVGTPIDVKVT